MDLKLTVFILSVLFCATWAAQVHVEHVPASEAQEIIYYEDDSDDTVMPPYEPGRERSSTDPLNVCCAPKQKQRKSLSSSEKTKKTNNFFDSGDSYTIDRSDSVESNRPFALCRSRSRTYSFCDSSEEETVLTPETFSDFPVAGPRLLSRRPPGMHRSSSGRNPSIDSIPEATTEDD